MVLLLTVPQLLNDLKETFSPSKRWKFHAHSEMPAIPEYRKIWNIEIFRKIHDTSTIQQDKYFRLKLLVKMFQNTWHLCTFNSTVGLKSFNSKYLLYPNPLSLHPLLFFGTFIVIKGNIPCIKKQSNMRFSSFFEKKLTCCFYTVLNFHCTQSWGCTCINCTIIKTYNDFSLISKSI